MTKGLRTKSLNPILEAYIDYWKGLLKRAEIYAELTLE